MRSCSISGCSTGDACTGYSGQSRAGADETGKSSGARALYTSFVALTVCTIPLSSFCSFALLFLYTGFALVFFLFSQLLGLQVKANSVEFAGSFTTKASQDLAVVLPKGSAALVQHISAGQTAPTGCPRTPSRTCQPPLLQVSKGLKTSQERLAGTVPAAQLRGLGAQLPRLC